MKRVVTGVTPTGHLTLGNYLGAMKRWAAEQKGRQNFYFIPNLHSLNLRQDPKTLEEGTLGAAAWLLAAGVDPQHATIFVQSQVPAHSELAWILSNYVTMGELSRMTQYKEKSRQRGTEGQLVGLFEYPVLMAADILLYDADEVPVGDDQKQHVELTRDIAERFNKLYGRCFKIPEPTFAMVGSRIMNLQVPTLKMSKSDPDPAGNIYLLDPPETIRGKIKRAVTDSGTLIKADPKRPAISNLLEIFAAVSGKTVKEIEKDYARAGYAKLKADLADAVVAVLEPLQRSYDELISRPDQLLDVLEQGRQKAAAIAEPKLMQVKAKIGLI